MWHEPHDCLDFGVEGPSWTGTGGAQPYPSSFPQLKRHRWEFRSTDVGRISRSCSWREENWRGIAQEMYTEVFLIICWILSCMYAGHFTRPSEENQHRKELQRSCELNHGQSSHSAWGHLNSTQSYWQALI